jgi:hypothetical protein
MTFADHMNQGEAQQRNGDRADKRDHGPENREQQPLSSHEPHRSGTAHLCGDQRGQQHQDEY